VKERTKQRALCSTQRCPKVRHDSQQYNFFCYIYRRDRRTYCILSRRAIITGVKVCESLQSVHVCIVLLFHATYVRGQLYNLTYQDTFILYEQILHITTFMILKIRMKY